MADATSMARKVLLRQAQALLEAEVTRPCPELYAEGEPACNYAGSSSGLVVVDGGDPSRNVMSVWSPVSG
jgi:hypothetical protein